MTNKINLNRSALIECRRQFRKHYQLSNGSKLKDSITVNWAAFKYIVQNHSGILLQNEMVLRFIHRLEGSAWFLTMECCHINNHGVIDFIGNRFDLSDHSIAESHFEGQFDAHYQRSIYYDGISLDKLVAIKSVMLPWEQEIVEAASINGIFSDETVNLKFASISYEYISQSNLVKQPHLLAMLFSSDTGVDLIDDSVVQSNSLITPLKAFNMGSLCPPCCDHYKYYNLFFKPRKAIQSVGAPAEIAY